MTSERERNIVALISVLLLLLAFFMLMVSRAEFRKDRTREVLESVQNSFAGVEVPRLGPEPGESAEERLADLQEEIRRQVRAVVPGATVQASATGTVILGLPAQALFGAGEDQVRAAVLPSLGSLVALLRRSPAEYRYSIELAVGAVDRQLPRAGALAEAFARQGAELDRLMVSVSPEFPETVRLVFAWRDADAAAAGGEGRL